MTKTTTPMTMIPVPIWTFREDVTSLFFGFPTFVVCSCIIYDYCTLRDLLACIKSLELTLGRSSDLSRRSRGRFRGRPPSSPCNEWTRLHDTSKSSGKRLARQNVNSRKDTDTLFETISDYLRSFLNPQHINIATSNESILTLQTNCEHTCFRYLND